MKKMTMIVPAVLGKTCSDSENSSEEEEDKKTHISVKSITNLYGMRRMVHLEKNNKFMPVSIFIIGTDEEIIGIKVTCYNDTIFDD